MKKYQFLEKSLSLRRMFRLFGVIALSLILSALSFKVYATNGDTITTADKTYVFDQKIHIPWLGASNNLFKASFNIPSPGTNTIDGDRYQASLTFTKLPNNDYRLIKVIPYMDSPTFNITNSGGATVASGAYQWNEMLQAWALPNPLVDNTNSHIDTSKAVNGSLGVKIYMTGISTGFMPLSTLKNDPALNEIRPVFLLGDVATLAPNTTQNISFNLYQERAYNGDPNKWHALNFEVPALIQYEYDGQITGTNPVDQIDLIPGDNALFESEVNLTSPQKITADMVWQISKDNGVSFNDIPESLTNSEGNKTIHKTLDFVSEIPNEGSLYRLKITPNSSINAEPIYTEPALLTFKTQSLTFNIKYVLNGGTNHNNNPLTYKYGQGVDHFEAPYREGYAFTGWTDNDGNNITNISVEAQGEKTLYANWIENRYQITYILNGGNNHKKNPTYYVYGRGVDSFENATRVGHTFIGWTDNDGNPIKNIATDVQGKMILHANWKANNYKINYILNGGENSKNNPDTYVYGQGISHFEKASRRGYTFKGWTDNDGNNIEIIPSENLGDVTLYACWEKITVVSTENTNTTNSSNSMRNATNSNTIELNERISESPDSGKRKDNLPQNGEKDNLYSLGITLFIIAFLFIMKKNFFNK